MTEPQPINAELKTYWATVQASLEAEGGITHSDTHTGLGVVGCVDCDGMGYYRLDAPQSDAQFGKMHRCGCQAQTPADMAMRANRSGLADDELTWQVDSLALVDGQADAVLAVRSFVANPTNNVTLVGPYGAGKTRLAKTALAERFAGGDEVRYIRVPDLLEQMRATFGERHLSANDVMSTISNDAVVVVDEAEQVNLTSWAGEQIYTLFDNRYLAGRTIFVMSNEFHQKARHLSVQWGAMLSRMSGGAWVELTCGDLRPSVGAARRAGTGLWPAL